MPRTKKELENRLKELEGEIISVRENMQALTIKGREIIVKAKASRDESLLSGIRKKLGL